MINRLAAAAMVVAISTASSVAAQEPVSPAGDPAPPLQIPRVEESIQVDGVLDEPLWRQAWTMTLDYEVKPGENTPAPVRTEVFVMHDNSRLYVGFRAHDPDPKKIRAHLADRDQAWDDDWVGVVFDTFNDERRDYVFMVNPLGVQMDFIEVGLGKYTPWDGIWRSAATITEWGWSAEMEIPFSTLRFQRSAGPQIWGFDAFRGYPRNVTHQIGAFPVDRSNNCYLCQALKIEGFAGVSPGRNVEIVPTLTASRTDLRDDFPDGSLVEGDSDIEVGLTARWGVTPNLTLSGTINPDYSQVEADARQLQVNRPFAIFFPELRPFFMEGADFFDTLMNVVYTRMMRDPSWGLKLTGKEGAHTVGAYVVDDEITNLIIPGSQGSDFTVLDQANRATVLRYKYDFGNRFTVGGLFTNREGDNYLNRVAGIDGDFRITPKDRVVLQLMSSSTRYPGEIVEDFDQPAGTFDDWAAQLYYSHSTRTWSWWAIFSDVGEGFRADLGFMPQVDVKHREVGLGHQWNATEGSWYSRLDLKAKVEDTVDQSGFLLFHEDVIQFTAEGPLQSRTVFRVRNAREGFNGQIFDVDQIRLRASANPNAHSQIWLDLVAGDAIDYVNTRPGEVLSFYGFLSYRFGQHLYIEPTYTRERMDVDEGWLYTATIGQLTASWQFNPRCFVRAILQHVDNQFNPDLYTDDRGPEYRNLFTQFLFSYKLNPRTVLFVGYSDNSTATQGYSLTRTDRTIFAKIGYAWVF